MPKRIRKISPIAALFNDAFDEGYERFDHDTAGDTKKIAEDLSEELVRSLKKTAAMAKQLSEAKEIIHADLKEIGRELKDAAKYLGELTAAEDVGK